MNWERIRRIFLWSTPWYMRVWAVYEIIWWIRGDEYYVLKKYVWDKDDSLEGTIFVELTWDRVYVYAINDTGYDWVDSFLRLPRNKISNLGGEPIRIYPKKPITEMSREELIDMTPPSHLNLNYIFQFEP